MPAAKLLTELVFTKAEAHYIKKFLMIQRDKNGNTLKWCQKLVDKIQTAQVSSASVQVTCATTAAPLSHHPHK